MTIQSPLTFHWPSLERERVGNGRGPPSHRKRPAADLSREAAELGVPFGIAASPCWVCPVLHESCVDNCNAQYAVCSRNAEMVEEMMACAEAEETCINDCNQSEEDCFRACNAC